MMTSSETEVDNLEEKAMEDSAVLEVSSMAVGGLIKQESRDPDFLSNYSTSVEGSVVRITSNAYFKCNDNNNNNKEIMIVQTL